MIMRKEDKNLQSICNNFTGPNEAYIDERNTKELRNPDDGDSSLREFFENYGKPSWLASNDESTKVTSEITYEKIKKITRAIEFIEAIRRYGHLEADIYPVGS